MRQSKNLITLRQLNPLLSNTGCAHALTTEPLGTRLFTKSKCDISIHESVLCGEIESAEGKKKRMEGKEGGKDAFKLGHG